MIFRKFASSFFLKVKNENISRNKMFIWSLSQKFVRYSSSKIVVPQVFKTTEMMTNNKPLLDTTSQVVNTTEMMTNNNPLLDTTPQVDNTIEITTSDLSSLEAEFQVDNTTELTANDLSSLEAEFQVDSTTEMTANDLSSLEAAKKPKLKKKIKKIHPLNHAILFSYVGGRYFGIQNDSGSPWLPTIGNALLYAMLQLNIIAPRARNHPWLIKLEIAGRTDKGVSAAKQIINCNFTYPVADLAELPSKLNALLPFDIRVWKVIEVAENFSSRKYCNQRSYSYICPTFIFSPIDAIANRDYRITPDILNKLEQMLGMYVGTHRFHNFTSGVKIDERRALRTITEALCEAPFVYRDLEFIKIKITGNSFLMHQIRRMIGYMAIICRGMLPYDEFKSCFDGPKFILSRMPSAGLVKEEATFDKYNILYKNHEDESLRHICWDDVEEDVQKFRMNSIDKYILDEELSHNTYLRWLSQMSSFDYGVLDRDVTPIRGISRVRLALRHINELNNHVIEENQPEQQEPIDDEIVLQNIFKN